VDSFGGPGVRLRGDEMLDSYELSKIAAGVLLALLVIILPKTFIDLAKHGHSGDSKDGYTLPVAEAPAPAGGAEGEGAAPAAAGFDAAAVVAKLATAKPEDGQGTFKKCLACHTADASSGNKAGPNLWNIVGRDHAGKDDFAGYSDAMKAKKGTPWSYEELAKFLHAPKAAIPGTKMIFAGVADPDELANLIAYIRTLADSPQPLP
jgi:cytochrome c